MIHQIRTATTSIVSREHSQSDNHTLKMKRCWWWWLELPAQHQQFSIKRLILP